MKRKIRMGMVGGGQGSFIGAVHRIAANLDGQIELVCGASVLARRIHWLPDNLYFYRITVFTHLIRR